MQDLQSKVQTSGRKYRVGIVGAGSIGCFLGAILAKDVDLELLLFGRDYMGLELAAHGLTASWQQGTEHYQASVAAVAFYTSFVSLIEADVVLLAVKATALIPLLQQIKPHLRSDVPIIALQNGIGIIDIIQSQLHNPVLRAIVPFNVVSPAPGQFKQSSSGDLLWPVTDLAVVQYLQQVFYGRGLDVRAAGDMKAAEYGKLLLNLNNALNAVSGLPLRAQLLNRHWRLLLSAAMREWLLICSCERVRPLQFTGLKPALLPLVLRLPDWLFRRVAARMLRIDPQARLSMSADLASGRRTEIAFLNGAVARLGKQHHIATPVNQAIVDLVHQKQQDQAFTADPAILCRQLRLG
jgi:2-dehydropantoate 2-reductase